MIMRKYQLLILLSIFPIFCYAQEPGPISVKGHVRDSKTNEPVLFVNVINNSTKTVVATNEHGDFNIPMNQADTLIFSAIGFEKYAFTLKEDVDLESLELTILLDSKVMELEPVLIFAYRDEKALKQAILDTKVEIEKDFVLFGMPSLKSINQSDIENFPKGSNVTPQVVLASIDIDRLIQKHSKKSKEKKAYNALVKKKEVIEQKFNHNWIQRVTNLEPEKINDFIVFCKIEDDFIELSSEYEITVAVLNCLKEFNKLNH